MRAALQVYWRLALADLRSRMQYRWSFISCTLLYGLVTVTDLLLVAAIMLRFDSMRGWSIYEVGILFGLVSIAMGLFRMFGNELHHFDRYLISGDFDGLLIRPWPTLLVLCSRNLDFSRFGAVLQGGVVVGICATKLLGQGVLDAPALVVLAMLPLPGMLIIGGMSLLTSALAFWFEQVEELRVFTLYASTTAGNFPVDIYPDWLRWLFFSVVPVAYINYVPVRYLLGRGGTWLALAAPWLAAGLVLSAGGGLWYLGERYYRSTGT